MEKEWFERWFGDEYKSLYPYRDDAQAETQVRVLVEACSAAPSWNILDVACGSGRHLRSFRKHGFEKSFGIDLSQVLIHDARKAALSVARADMRRLPFANATFELLTCFFTSFGYFATRDEDVSTLREFFRVLKPGGLLFLDLANQNLVMKNLVPHDTKKIDGDEVEVERFLKGDQVVKIIRCKSDGGKAYEERVRLYALNDLKALLDGLEFSILRLFGDEHGSEYSPETSPRMGLLLRRD